MSSEQCRNELQTLYYVVHVRVNTIIHAIITDSGMQVGNAHATLKFHYFIIIFYIHAVMFGGNIPVKINIIIHLKDLSNA